MNELMSMKQGSMEHIELFLTNWLTEYELAKCSDQMGVWILKNSIKKSIITHVFMNNLLQLNLFPTHFSFLHLQPLLSLIILLETSGTNSP